MVWVVRRCIISYTPAGPAHLLLRLITKKAAGELIPLSIGLFPMCLGAVALVSWGRPMCALGLHVSSKHFTYYDTQICRLT